MLVSTAAAQAQIPRDTVVMAKRLDDIVSLDPAEAYEFSDEEAIGNLYERLLDYDPAHPENIKGMLAQDWRVDDDGLTYRFTLRPKARFASGAPVTAEDVAFSLQRVILLNLTPAFVLTQFGLTPDNVMQRIRVEAGGVVLQTASRVAPSLLYYCLASSVGSVVERAQALAHQAGDDFGHQWLAFHSAGSGPYRLRAWRPGERIAFDAVPEAWAGAAKNRTVILLNVPEPAAQRLLLEEGDADYARDLDKDQIASLARSKGIVFDRALQLLSTYMALNQRNEYLRRPQVIEALKYLVDYDGIANQLLAGTEVVHQSFLPEGVLGASEDNPYRFDPARAKTLLAEAGLGGGFSVGLDTIGAAPWLDIAQALQAGFARAGVRLEIRPGDEKEVLTKYRARRHDIFLGPWGSDYPDPQSNAQAFVGGEDLSDNATLRTLAWRSSWKNPELSHRLDAAAAEPDIAKREAMYRALQRDHQAIAPFILMFQDVAVAAHRSSVTGFVLGASPDHTLYAGIKKQ